MPTLPIDPLDLNSAWDAIVARIAAVDGIRAVRGAVDLEKIINGQTTGSNHYAFVTFDGIELLQPAGNSTRHQTVDIAYQVVIAELDYSNDGKPQQAGVLLGRVLSALMSFAPFTDDKRSSQRLRAVTPPRAVHRNKYSLYPLKFILSLHIKGEQL
ncbi:hypothetical protein [Dichelobacter nodosus]|uniref:Uncharacterized protein n=1 Tax=Dichelobacter nodosus (strain VCS1703A) TaxID=246195 RepID=A5EUZ0_DICNV|nr:hypothetical protein [Dichelobacter nodosus]ABQ13124.1 hypothetical protein DNO_0751 [Dichelobacter nodosus VCS1703A]KNZ40131.1 hypothetical protein AKG33_00200 [Dichelobacter nodosus]